MVACGVMSVGYVELILNAFLRRAAGKVAFALLGDNIGDIAFLGLEIIAHCGGLIVGAFFIENRLADYLAG